MAELCEAVAAKGGNVIIIGDVEEQAEYKIVLCQMQGKRRALAMDMACIVHRKDCKPIRGIMEAANMMLEITEKVTKVAAADAEVTNETTEERSPLKIFKL